MTKKSWYSITAAANNGEADIFLYDFIGGWGMTAKDFARDLKALGNVSKINLHINCPGGDVFDGTAIYNLLKDHKAEVETWIEGIAASMGSVIALAGDTVHIAENAYYMVHNPAAFAAERAFRKWGEPSTYTDSSGTESIGCRVIKDQEICELEDEERVRVPRIELSLLVSEVGPYNSGAVVTLGRVAYTVCKRLADDGVVWRALVDG
ncbi:head maturation protease, ClpP-related [Microbulbifer variabilis]|uniref:head maturation protease, ClpP-related n=1 Tax=Microbulbifer variabilis TaxID=266805 RepID=UPI001CFD0ABF|nr:head maturation protease, ClpP-related [Microbulbifer variabilis]